MQSLARVAGVARDWASGAAENRASLVALATQGFDWAYGKAIAGMPGLEGAAELATKYAGRHASTDQAVKAIIGWHTGMAGAAGFVTGVGGFAALPVAMPAYLASALYIQVRLVAAIAHLRGHDIKSAEVRALVLACLTGSRAADTLKDVGVRFGTRLTRDVLGWASPAVLKKIEHSARLPLVGAVAAQGAGRFGRVVPLIGGLVAGGFDAAMTQLIGRTADRVFSSATFSEVTGAASDGAVGKGE